MPISSPTLRGLIAATFTPFHRDGAINFDAIPQLVDHLLEHNIAGMYVLGSTGEGVSLTYEERRAVAEAFVLAADGRLQVIVTCVVVGYIASLVRGGQQRDLRGLTVFTVPD